MGYRPLYFFLANGLGLISFLLLFNNIKELKPPIVVESTEHTTAEILVVKSP